MNIKAKAVLHNKFEVTVVNAQTGKVKQTAEAYNVVTDEYFKMRLNLFTNTDWPDTDSVMGYIGVGSGSGTPSTSDTALFNALIHKSSTLVEEHYDYPTSYITRQIKINADECNGSTLTEVSVESYYSYGLWSSDGYLLCTHAMLQDAEGNPIAISKTDVDVVYITAKIYCTFTQSGFGTNGVYPTAANNILVKWLLNGTTGLKVNTHRFPVEYASDLSSDYVHSKSFTFQNGTGTLATLTWELPSMTILDTEFNNHLVRSIGIPGIGAFNFPDSSVFPDYEVDHLVLGEGDGTTTQFNVKCPLIKSGSAHVYVGGDELSASQYTFDYESNCTNTRDNSHTAAMKVDGTSVTFGDMATRSPATNYLYGDPLYWGLWPKSGYTYPASCVISSANPVWIDFGSAKACNQLQIDNAKISTSYVDNLVIEYSADNSNWTAVTYTREETAYTSSIYYYTWKFSEVSARYWRVYIPNYSWTYSLYYQGSTLGTRDNTSVIKSSFFLGRSVPGLTLVTAPQSGETVEASYKLEVPYKTANNLMRITCSIQLQRG